jgi:hypothetical protein
VSTYTREGLTIGGVTKSAPPTFSLAEYSAEYSEPAVDFTDREDPPEFSLTPLDTQPDPLVLPYGIPVWAAALGILSVLYLLQQK